MIKNLILDEVLNTVDNFYNDNTLKGQVSDFNETTKEDIIVYILNRIPPKYIASSRGYNYFSSEQNAQDKIDLLALFFEAVSHISRRQESNTLPKEVSSEVKTWFNFPQIYGCILSGDTLAKLPGAKVTLFINNELAISTGERFSNPYVTHKNTEGHYCFWPDPIENKENIAQKEFILKLEFEHSCASDPVILCEKIMIASSAFVDPSPRRGYRHMIKNAYL